MFPACLPGSSLFMSSRLFLSVSLVFSLAALAGRARLGAVETPLHYTLREAMGAVEGASLSVLLGREALAQAIETTNNTRAGILPNISLEAGQRRNKSAAVGATLNRTGVSDRFDANLIGRLDLLDPQLLAAYAAARRGVAVAELDFATVREDALAAVAQAYLAHLRNIERITVFEASIVRARALRDLAQRQADAGVATQIDVTRAEALLAAARQDKLQQQTVVATSELRFKRLLGLAVDQPVELAPLTLGEVRETTFSGAMEETAFERRSDYLSARERLKQNELEVRAAKFNRLPSIGLSGSYGYATERVLDGGEANIWSTAVTLSVPIFDGARTGALTRLALSRRRAQEVRVRDLEFGVAAEVRLAVQNVRSRRELVEVARFSQRLAEQELELAETRFAQGVADNREIVEAQNRLAVASDGLVEANFQYKLSQVELSRATGEVRRVLELAL